jgi:two-component system phosphate regulon response regulator PhoB
MARTILVIDDDPAQGLAASVFLRKYGFEISVAQDAYSATSQASQLSPCLILLDFEMPAGTGADVYKRLRMISQTSNVPVIFISGRKPEEISAMVGESRLTRFLGKPVDWTRVVDLIRELLPGSIPDAAAPDKPAV